MIKPIGCLVKILPNGRLHSVLTTEGAEIKNVISIEFKQSVFEKLHDISRISLELHVSRVIIVSTGPEKTT
jgi:hypothetical protein